jgi:protease II
MKESLRKASEQKSNCELRATTETQRKERKKTVLIFKIIYDVTKIQQYFFLVSNKDSAILRITNQIDDNPASTSKQIIIYLENLKTILLDDSKAPAHYRA